MISRILILRGVKWTQRQKGKQLCILSLLKNCEVYIS